VAPWKGNRKDSWASNPNLAVYVFATLFTVWLGFQIWARIGGQPAPTELGPMVMSVLAVAITVKSAESRQQSDEMKRDLEELKRDKEGADPDAAEGGDNG
jgi:hypothetical protein